MELCQQMQLIFRQAQMGAVKAFTFPAVRQPHAVDNGIRICRHCQCFRLKSRINNVFF